MERLSSRGRRRHASRFPVRAGRVVVPKTVLAPQLTPFRACRGIATTGGRSRDPGGAARTPRRCGASAPPGSAARGRRASHTCPGRSPSSGSPSAVREEVEPPVVAPQEASLPRREVDPAEQSEAELAVDRVPRGVLDHRESVYEPVLLLRPRPVDDLGGRRACDASSLEARDHGSSDLPDLLVVPGRLPVADPSDMLATGLDDAVPRP